ncbi:metallophosphoesterase [Paucibacter sp. APW11]|uniref:Metallophosphoesterase n=1 Tax=Roseateles aquae TaxID=3077235 RepID=A0ABU3PA95_9BURK|nr:metallophosphoesterase [Paucibacter sp. APW11]MDT8999023.1 metallophosphoesterase [Paucibacter sp. APW11]
MKKTFKISLLAASLLAGGVRAEPFSFGFMADTQWTSNDAANNPSTVALGIMNQILPKFVEHKVKFVLQFGDLTDNGSNAGLDVWKNAAQQLYSNGIGFYPVRGNHEPSSAAANRFVANFPQTQGLGPNVAGATGHRSPSSPTGLTGLSYAFEYGNATFIAIDQFVRSNGSSSSANSATLDQVNWIEQTLINKPAGNHAFLFAHKPLIGQNHVDNLLGANPSSNPTQRNQLIKAMAGNGARYFLSGHDHLYNRAIVKSPDGTAFVHNIIHSSDSYKFYIPTIPSNDQAYNATNRQEIPISQELFTVGYYIAKIDGPNLTVTHYASDNGCGGSLGAGKDCDLKATPTLNFVKRESYGYSLIGKEFIIPHGGSFTGIQDQSPRGSGWAGTSMALLDGVNTVSAKFYDGRLPVQDVNTGWQSRADAKTANLKSDVLTLWGMHNNIGSEQADVYTLSLRYEDAARGALALMSKDEDGRWVKAATRNFGGSLKFVAGPYKPGTALGTFGVDHASKTVWAVLNRGGEFAVMPSLDGDLNGDGVVDSRDIELLQQMLANASTPSTDADLDNDGKLSPLDLRKLALLCTLPNCAIAR